MFLRTIAVALLASLVCAGIVAAAALPTAGEVLTAAASQPIVPAPAPAADSSLYESSRDVLLRFGSSLKQTGVTVKDSLVKGYNISVDRISSALGSAAKTTTPTKRHTAAVDDVDPMLMAADTNVAVALAKGTNSSNKTGNSNSTEDKIVFRSEDDEVELDPFDSIPPSVETVTLDTRIVIDVPADCPVGKSKAADGNCRKIVKRQV